MLKITCKNCGNKQLKLAMLNIPINHDACFQCKQCNHTLLYKTSVRVFRNAFYILNAIIIGISKILSMSWIFSYATAFCIFGIFFATLAVHMIPLENITDP